MSELKLSIALCTRNRACFLGEALESLLRQTYPLEHVEIIVVDNASVDGTQAVVDKYSPLFPNFLCVVEPRVGLSHARNTALTQARAKWIAYLDDDGKARPDWVSQAMQVMQSDVFDCFGGLYVPWLKYGPLPFWFPESLTTNAWLGTEQCLLGDWKFPPGGNCFFKVNIAKGRSIFSPALGMRGKALGYAEETAVFQHMKNCGYRVGYAPQVVIEHCVQRYKYSWLWHMRYHYVSGRDSIAVENLRADSRPLWLVFWRFVQKPFKCLQEFTRQPFRMALYSYCAQNMRILGGLIGKCRLTFWGS